METITEILNVKQAAEHRRSIRTFTGEPIPQEDLNEILRLTGLAPSAFNLQPWRFVIANSAAAREQLAGGAYQQRQVLSAPTVLILYTDMKDTLEHLDETFHPGMAEEQREQGRKSIMGSFSSRSEIEREAWGAEQGNIALGYLLLAAEGLGYQTSPMLGFDPDAVKRSFGLPEHVRIPALIAIGRGAEEGFPHHRHPVTRIARAA
jgi:nitroreductase